MSLPNLYIILFNHPVPSLHGVHWRRERERERKRERERERERGRERRFKISNLNESSRTCEQQTSSSVSRCDPLSSTKLPTNATNDQIGLKEGEGR